MGPGRRPRRSAVAIALLTLVALGLASCGDEGTSADAGADASDHSGHVNMGDATATPASAAGGELVSGEFELLVTRPPSLDEVEGSADLARTDAGTTVTVKLAGLVPNEDYIAHVHFGSCEKGLGHFQFDEGGATVPPNEIHLAFTAGEDGSGFMTAENDDTVGNDARSVVVHPKELMDNKIACADLA